MSTSHIEEETEADDATHENRKEDCSYAGFGNHSVHCQLPSVILQFVRLLENGYGEELFKAGRLFNVLIRYPLSSEC